MLSRIQKEEKEKLNVLYLKVSACFLTEKANFIPY